MKFAAALSLVVLFFGITSCKKEEVPIVHSNAEIEGAVLKQADNGFLFTTDTLGILHQDTVTFILPGGGNPTLVLLKPTIFFKGDSIRPASGTSQNFAIPVTYTVYGSDHTTKKYIVQVKYTSKNVLLVNTDRLFALDLGTGVVRWIAENNWNVNFVTSSPLINQDTVYSCVGNGELYAVSAIDGTKFWSQKFAYGLLSSPVIANGVLYAGCGDGTLYAVNSHDGLLRWFKKFDAFGVFTTPTVSNSMVYVQVNQQIVAVDASSGNTIWTSPVKASFYASVLLGGDLLYASGADSNIYALDKNTGAVAWSFHMGDNGTSPALSNGVLYAAAYNDSLFALDAATGARKWAVFVNTGPSNPSVSYPGIQSNPVVTGNAVVIGGGDPNLYAFNIADGSLTWMTPLGNIVKSGIPYVDGVLYPNTGSVSAVDAVTGKINWSQLSGAGMTPSVISKEGAVYNAMN